MFEEFRGTVLALSEQIEELKLEKAVLKEHGDKMAQTLHELESRFKGETSRSESEDLENIDPDSAEDLEDN